MTKTDRKVVEGEWIMRDLRELDDPQLGSDLWLERLDTFAGDAWGLSADILQESLEREFSVSPDVARQMALVELEHVTEDEFAKLREEIASGREEFLRMLEAFRKIQGTFIPFE